MTSETATDRELHVFSPAPASSGRTKTGAVAGRGLYSEDEDDGGRDDDDDDDEEGEDDGALDAGADSDEYTMAYRVRSMPDCQTLARAVVNEVLVDPQLGARNFENSA